MENKIVVHFYITPNCKMNCPFCYAFEHKSLFPPLSTREVEKLIKACRRLGAKSMVFCGGDPFSRSDIAEIINIAKDNSMTTRIDSNLLSYSTSVMQEVAPYLDWLALPLDGPNEIIHDTHRNWKGHYKIISCMIQCLQTSYPDVALKLHTLVTKENYESLFEMPSLINEIKPSIWSVYTYFRAGVGRDNFQRYELSKSQISKVHTLKSFPLVNNIDIVSSESHNNAYIFIAADGRVYRQPKTQGADYSVFGDFREGALEKAVNELDMLGNRRRASIYE